MGMATRVMADSYAFRGTAQQQGQQVVRFPKIRYSASAMGSIPISILLEFRSGTEEVGEEPYPDDSQAGEPEKEATPGLFSISTAALSHHGHTV